MTERMKGMEGFTYNGVHCEEMGLTYIPSAKEMFFTAPSYKPITQTVTAHPGAYWYGNDISPREFELPCFYEDITWEQLEDIFQWVDRNSKGKLVFDDRPDVYYLVRPTKEPTGDRYVGHYSCSSPDELVYSGRITLQFTAYDPFGYLNLKELVSWDNDAKIGNGLILASMMPPTSTDLGDHLIYNPGTEDTPLRIKIAGTAPNGLTIHNYTTGEVCKLVSLPDNDTLVIDGATGMVAFNSTKAAAFEFHNDGYIHLASCVPYQRDMVVVWATGSKNITTSNGKFRKRDVGSYIYLGGYWRKIAQVAETGATLTQAITECDGSESEEEAESFELVRNIQPTDNPKENGWYELPKDAEPWDVPTKSNDTVPDDTKDYYIRYLEPVMVQETTVMAKMNEIYIEGDGATLSTLSFEYTPRVR